MILTITEAKSKFCVFCSQKGTFPMAPNAPIETMFPKCIAEGCMANWRWMDPSKAQGYCAIGGKPEY